MEYPFDTTRAIASLLFSGTLARCPDVKFIFAHGGGTMPFLANRIGTLVKTRKELNAMLPNGIAHELKKLYFDVVSVTNRPAWAALGELMEPGHLLFGTDIPYMTFEQGLKELKDMEPDTADRRAIEFDNAVRIMPSLKAKAAAAAR
jgi:predicted TIM-barrel fold metal-dependent hydrolase